MNKENDYSNNSNPTQCEKIVRHLIDYGSITPLEALSEYGIMRLASRISELNNRGFRIVKTMEKAKNRYGESLLKPWKVAMCMIRREEIKST